MRLGWFLGALSMIALFAATLKGQSRDTLLTTLRQDPRWPATGNPITYSEQNIQELDRARAPAIKKYGLIGVSTQVLRSSDGQLRLTLYEMTDSSASYGLFTLERNYTRSDFTMLPIGQEGFLRGSSLFFWQSKYMIRIEGASPAREDLVRILSRNIVGPSSKPPVSKHLPPNNLIASSEKYLLDSESFARQVDLDPAQFGFDDGLEVATADYRIGENTAQLVLLLYPTQQIAKKYADSWEAKHSGPGPFHKRVGTLFGLVRGTRDEATAQAILAQVNYETQVTWNEPGPDLSLRELILTTFTFIGLALLFTFVVGVGFGGIRLYMKARYPDRFFDRSQDTEIIQLKLAEAVRRKDLRE